MLSKYSYSTTEDGISRFIGVTFYNTVHTAWPVLLLAFYDFDITTKHSERYPRLYHSGPAKSRFNVRVFLFWVFLSFIHSFVIFLFSWYGSGGCDSNGEVCQLGTTTFVGGNLTTLFLTIAVSVKVISEFARFYWWTIILLILSMLSYPVLMSAYTAQTTMEFGVSGDALQQYQVSQVSFSYGTTWIGILGVVGIVMLIDVLVKQYYRRFQTTFTHLVQEAESGGKPLHFKTTNKGSHGTLLEEGKFNDDPVPQSKDPFVILDYLDDQLWKLEKSGLLTIPGPKLPTFPSDDGITNPTYDRRDHEKSMELTSAASKNGSSKTDKSVNRRLSAQERSAANNGK